MFSLVVATVNRTKELRRLLESLACQTCQDFEVVIVDQNSDDRLLPLIHEFSTLTITHLRSERGLSRARNAAMPFVKGDVVAFPDDDCWYPNVLLATVSQWFSLHDEFEGLMGIMRTHEGEAILPRWPPSAGPCVKRNLWDCAVSTTIFLRRIVVERVGGFNESIGVGAATKCQSGEESDYLLRALGLGFHLWYEPTIWLHHPNLASTDRMARTAYSFAYGAGYVMRAHRYPWTFLSTRVIRAIGGAVLSLCKGDIPRSRAYLQRAIGQIEGYTLGPRNLARLRAKLN